MVDDSLKERNVGSTAQQLVENWKKSRLVMKSEELEYFNEVQGTSAEVVNAVLGFANKQLSAFIREIPVGWKSGKHTHNMEAIILIIKGNGHTVVDGVKHEWKQGDVITIPPMSVHQHFNASTAEAARFFAVTTIPLMVNIGSFAGEQMENAAKI